EKENLKQETIDQIDDPLYGNQIVPEDLNEKIASGEAVTVYFYSPRCVYCQRTTPVLVPLTEELNIDMKKLNLLEFKDEWDIEREKLKQETIEQIDEPLYGNQIVPEDLNEKIASGEAVTVYFYSPRCVYCQRTTPVLVPLTEELNIDMKKLNLLEFKDEWDIE